MKEIDIKTVSSAALAYLGDSVMEGCVREYLVREGLSSSAHLNEAALRFVRASEQAKAMKNIIDVLTEEEAAVYRRGRNVGHTATPKSATMSEYRTATGFEAVIGLLEWQGGGERLEYLLNLAHREEKDND